MPVDNLILIKIFVNNSGQSGYVGLFFKKLLFSQIQFKSKMSSGGVEPLIQAEGIYGLKHPQICFELLCVNFILCNEHLRGFIYTYIFVDFLTLIQLFLEYNLQKLYRGVLYVQNRNVPENLSTLKSKNQCPFAIL